VVPAGDLNTCGLANELGVWAYVALWFFFLSRAASNAQKELAREHQRSEDLLHNILPSQIASRLKDGEKVIADGVSEASVLFADIVGFTTLSASMSPADLVVLLNDVFSRIDAVVDRHGLEKIKTIGDAYMVASGLPKPRGDHAQVLAEFALDVLQVLEGVQAGNGAGLQMRIGMHSGAVVAGVIGKRKFAYDLWGDTVNTAARMESHGVPGRIQISRATFERLGGAFELEARGSVDVKGKGPMETWFLVRKAPAVQA